MSEVEIDEMPDRKHMKRTFIVVGYPGSGYELAQHLLNQVGVAVASHGKQQGLSPEQTMQTLLDQSAGSVSFCSPVTQIEPSPMWQGLLLDLVLGNQDRSLWGWADPSNIYFLEYLYKSDPSFHFVLLYSDPARVLADSLSRERGERAQLESHKQAWHNYHQALLAFFYRYQDRSLLIDMSALEIQPLSFVELVNERFDCQLITTVNDFSPVQQDSLSLLLAANYLEGSSVIADYAEMQSMADMPAVADLRITPLDALLAYREFQIEIAIKDEENTAVKKRLNDLSEENKVIVQQLHSGQKALEVAYRDFKVETSVKDEEISALKSQAAMKLDIKALEDENELLLQQLHTAQEALECYFLGKNKFQQPAIFTSAETGKQKYAGARHFGAADRVKGMLSYRLGAVMIKQASSVSGWLGMAAALLREARSFEVEKVLGEKTKLPPLSSYADAYEGERVKRHLSFRLGRTLLANYKSPMGWVKLPWLMRLQVAEFRRERAGKHDRF